MLRTTLTAAWSRKRRLFGTMVAVVLGVAFLTATLVVGDSARAGFSTAFGDAIAGTDALVRNESRFTGGESNVSLPIDAGLLDVVAATDGVASVSPSVLGVAQVLDAGGSPIGGGGPPTFGENWIDDPDHTGWDLADGEAPARTGEVVLDRATAADAGVSVGDDVTVLVPGPVTLTVVGIARFGDRDSLGGTTYVGFTLAEAQQRLLGSTERLSGVIASAADGVSQAELVQHLKQVLPLGTEAITGQALIAEQEDEIESDFLGVLTTGLLVFAGIALLVSAFSIFNTFSILVAQRTRESALLRALGASRRQVLLAAMTESAIVGVLGALAGLGTGVLLGAGLLALMDSAGFGLPLDGVQVGSGSLVTAFAVGLVVTLAAGVVPAWKSSRVPPLAALREVAVDTSGSSRARLAIGLASAVAGVAAVLTGGTGEGSLGRTGLGAVALLTGVVLLGPLLAGPVGSVLGAPLRLRGVSGDLARRNAVRNPRRTSGTAAALLVGVGVVSLFAVFGASLSRSIEESVDRTFAGDLVLTPAGSDFGGSGLPSSTATEVAALPEVDRAAGSGYGAVTLDGDDHDMDFGDLGELATLADFDVVEGDLAAVGDRGLAVSVDVAAEHGWTVGDAVDVGFVDGATEPFTVSALYGNDTMDGTVFMELDAWQAHNPQTAFTQVFVGLADGVSVDEGRTAVEEATRGPGAPIVRDRDQFIESEAGEVQGLLNVVYGLLAIAILIALMGIANTLSLSTHERTRELGLLRAVGQSRSQLRAMVRWESVVVATFGAVEGLGLGLFLGWGLVRALNASEGFGTFSLPVGTLVTVLVLGALIGVIAGLRPAWRASRLDVLAAVSAN